MTLRSRLVLILSGLLALGMAISVGATFGALQDWRNDQSDELLAGVAQNLRDGIEDGTLITPLQPGDDVEGTAQLTAVWNAATEHSDVPTFFQLRTSDGEVRQTLDFGATPQLPRTLPAELRPTSPTPDNPAGAGLHKLRSADGADAGWLLHTSALSDGTLIVGMQTTGADELVRRTAAVAATSAAVALLLVVLLSLRAVRRGLRPLESIAATASAIGDGDLTRRIPDADPHTEIGRLGGALNAMLGQLESAFEERRRAEERLRTFVADASHELRTPIATIRGYAELFRRGASERPADLAQAMARIESEAQRTGEMVEELLLLAKLDQGMPLELAPVDLAALAAEAVDDARVLDPGRPLFIENEAGGPVVVQGDAHRIRQALTNLLANVRHHTPDATEAVVRVGRASGQAVIVVADEGPGFSEEQSRHLFDRFFRVDHTRRPSESGTGGGEGSGLGLAIVVAVVKAHGGDVEATSPPGKGAVFRIRLPLDAPDDRARIDCTPGDP